MNEKLVTRTEGKLRSNAPCNNCWLRPSPLRWRGKSSNTINPMCKPAVTWWWEFLLWTCKLLKVEVYCFHWHYISSSIVFESIYMSEYRCWICSKPFDTIHIRFEWLAFHHCTLINHQVNLLPTPLKKCRFNKCWSDIKLTVCKINKKKNRFLRRLIDVS